MAYQDSLTVAPRRIFSWPGIFAGTFIFLGIETTFGVLAATIFGGLSLGFQIWMVVLSIIALYIAGRASTGVLARGSGRALGSYQGLVTFGMSIFATVLLIAAANLHMSSGLSAYVSRGGEYWLFVALVLSMISAIFGGAQGAGAALTPGTGTTGIQDTGSIRSVA